jgi:hypothetical protein
MRERAGAAVLQQRDDLLEHEPGDDHWSPHSRFEQRRLQRAKRGRLPTAQR